MNKLKENLLKQQELNKELNILISNLEDCNVTIEEKMEIQNISEDNININVHNIDLLRKRYVKLIKNPNITSTNKKILTTSIINLDNMKKDYEKLEKELLKSEKEILRNKKNNIVNSDEKSLKLENNIKSFEKNIGFYLINFIGLILVILGICTFGKYVYSNYMNNIIKGVFLYLVSTGIIIVGEKLLQNKNHKFSQGITGLGICMLYMTTFINYLFLHNLNEIIAIIISLLISILGIHISHKKDSGIIRIISLIGGLITLIPTNAEYYSTDYNLINSLMLLFFVIILNILHIYKPINKHEKIIINLSSIINFIFLCIAISFMNELIIVFLFILNILYNHYLFIGSEFEEKDLIIFKIISFLIAIISFNLNKSLIIAILITYIVLLFLSKKKTAYILNIFAIINYLSIRFINKDIIAECIFATIVLFIAYIDNEKPNILYKIAYVITLICLMPVTSGLNNITMFLIMNSVMFVSLFMYISQKEGKMFKAIKYYSVMILIYGLFAITTDYDIDTKIIILINIFIVSSCMYIFNSFELLRDRNIKRDNIIWLSGIVVLSLHLMIEPNIISIIGEILTTICLFIFINEEYIKINKNNKSIKYIIIPIYIMLSILSFDYMINNIIIIILLMILAVSVVYLGFENRNVIGRKVGIGIAIFTIIKLLVEAFDMNFIGRTITFIIVGILSLIIAFIYSEVDKNYKDK